MQVVKVAYIGLNNLYSKVTSLFLKQSPVINKLTLYGDDNTFFENVGNEIYRNSSTGCKILTYSGKEGIFEALQGVDIVVIGDELIKTKGNKIEYEGTALKIIDYVKAITQISPNAFLVIAASPVNIFMPFVAQVFTQMGYYNAKKLLGATSMDTIRANAVLAAKLNLDPMSVVLPVVGGGSPLTRVPLFSHAFPSTKLSIEEQKELLATIRNEDISNHEANIIEKAYATARFIHSIASAQIGPVEVPEIALVKNHSLWGEVDYFALPILIGREGIEKIFPLKHITDFEEKMVKEATDNIRIEVNHSKDLLNLFRKKINDEEHLDELNLNNENDYLFIHGKPFIWENNFLGSFPNSRDKFEKDEKEECETTMPLHCPAEPYLEISIRDKTKPEQKRKLGRKTCPSYQIAYDNKQKNIGDFNEEYNLKDMKNTLDNFSHSNFVKNEMKDFKNLFTKTSHLKLPKVVEDGFLLNDEADIDKIKETLKNTIDLVKSYYKEKRDLLNKQQNRQNNTVDDLEYLERTILTKAEIDEKKISELEKDITPIELVGDNGKIKVQSFSVFNHENNENNSLNVFPKPKESLKNKQWNYIKKLDEEDQNIIKNNMGSKVLDKKLSNEEEIDLPYKIFVLDHNVNITDGIISNNGDICNPVAVQSYKKLKSSKTNTYNMKEDSTLKNTNHQSNMEDTKKLVNPQNNESITLCATPLPYFQSDKVETDQENIIHQNLIKNNSNSKDNMQEYTPTIECKAADSKNLTTKPTHSNNESFESKDKLQHNISKLKYKISSKISTQETIPSNKEEIQLNSITQHNNSLMKYQADLNKSEETNPSIQDKVKQTNIQPQESNKLFKKSTEGGSITRIKKNIDPISTKKEKMFIQTKNPVNKDERVSKTNLVRGLVKQSNAKKPKASPIPSEIDAISLKTFDDKRNKKASEKIKIKVNPMKPQFYNKRNENIKNNIQKLCGKVKHDSAQVVSINSQNIKTEKEEICSNVENIKENINVHIYSVFQSPQIRIMSEQFDCKENQNENVDYLNKNVEKFKNDTSISCPIPSAEEKTTFKIQDVNLNDHKNFDDNTKDKLLTKSNITVTNVIKADNLPKNTNNKLTHLNKISTNLTNNRQETVEDFKVESENKVNTSVNNSLIENILPINSLEMLNSEISDIINTKKKITALKPLSEKLTINENSNKLKKDDRKLLSKLNMKQEINITKSFPKNVSQGNDSVKQIMINKKNKRNCNELTKEVQKQGGNIVEKHESLPKNIKLYEVNRDKAKENDDINIQKYQQENNGIVLKKGIIPKKSDQSQNVKIVNVPKLSSFINNQINIKNKSQERIWKKTEKMLRKNNDNVKGNKRLENSDQYLQEKETKDIKENTGAYIKLKKVGGKFYEENTNKVSTIGKNSEKNRNVTFKKEKSENLESLQPRASNETESNLGKLLNQDFHTKKNKEGSSFKSYFVNEPSKNIKMIKPTINDVKKTSAMSTLKLARNDLNESSKKCINNDFNNKNEDISLSLLRNKLIRNVEKQNSKLSVNNKKINSKGLQHFYVKHVNNLNKASQKINQNKTTDLDRRIHFNKTSNISNTTKTSKYEIWKPEDEMKLEFDCGYLKNGEKPSAWSKLYQLFKNVINRDIQDEETRNNISRQSLQQKETERQKSSVNNKIRMYSTKINHPDWKPKVFSSRETNNKKTSNDYLFDNLNKSSSRNNDNNKYIQINSKSTNKSTDKKSSSTVVASNRSKSDSQLNQISIKNKKDVMAYFGKKTLDYYNKHLETDGIANLSNNVIECRSYKKPVRMRSRYKPLYCNYEFNRT